MNIERLLSRAQFRSTLFGVVDAGAPWSARIAGIDGAVMYGVLTLPVWFEGGGVADWLQKGDFVLLPRGADHRIASAPDAGPDASALELIHRRPAGQFVLRHGGDGALASLFAAAAVWDDYSRAVAAPMLPDAAIVRAGEFSHASLAMEVARMIEREARAPRPNAIAIVGRAINLALIEFLTAFAGGADWRAAWLKSGLAPQIARALHIVHSSAANDWTTTTLARRVGLSRSAFSAKFKEMIGVAPGAYLINHRLGRAAALLAETRIDVAQAAEFVGYESTPSFIKAFKRRYGVPPSAYRAAAGDAQDPPATVPTRPDS